MRSFVAVGMGFCVLLAGAACPSARDPMPGGWSKVSVKGEGVVQAAQFAVKAQQEAMKADGKGEKIILVKILSAQHQVVAGSNYNLALRVTVGGTVKTAEATVWVQLWLKPEEQYKLTSWKFTDEKDPKPAR